MRDRIEQAFSRWGRIAFRHAWAVIGVVLLLTAALGSQLPKTSIDTSTEGFFHAKDPVRVRYDAFREAFGQDQMIQVTVEAEDLFSLATLERLRALHEEIEDRVPMLVEVTSLVNARETRGEGDELIVGELMEDWPTSEAEVAAIRERAMANPVYLDSLVSRDASLTTILIETEAWSREAEVATELGGFDDAGPAVTPPMLSGEEVSRIVGTLLEVLDRHEGPGFQLHPAGSPVFVDQFSKSMQADMRVFFGLSVLAIAVLLAALFRRVAGVALPLVIVVLSVASTLGFMAATGTPLMLPTQILPSFLLAVGVGGSVHILTIFYQARRRGEGVEDAIAHAMGHSGLAVLMTSLTTAGGLFGFLVAELRPIAHFGVFAPVGVMVALLYTLALLPALVAVFPMREESAAAEQGGGSLSQRLLLRAGDLATRRAGWVSAAWALLLAVAALGATRVQLAHDPVSWWPEGHEMRVATQLTNDRMRGSMFLEMLVETGERNGVQDPEILKGMAAVAEGASGVRVNEVFVGKTLSLADVVMEIHQALNENRPAYRAVPDDRQLVAQELLLFENSGSDDLENFVDSTFETGRVTFKMPFGNALDYVPMTAQLREVVERELPGVPFEFTGMGNLITHTIDAVMHTLVRSYVIALALVMPLLVILIGNLRLGLTAIIPNLAPITLTLGLMGWAGIGLDTFTLLIGCIAIGLAVDDTIHFMHNFRRYYARHGDVPRAVRETLTTTGQALLFTSVVLATGFLLYTQASMTVLFNFGFLTAFTIIMAFLADIVLAPALMMLVAKPRESTAAQPLEMEARS